MALEVEDGTGKANAQSYVSVAAADTYHSARLNEDWAGYDTPTKEAALLKATAWLDGAYWNSFVGDRLSTTQALAWPRVWSTTNPAYLEAVEPVLPQAIKDAACELALRAAAGDFMSDQDRGGAIRSKSVGPISIEYADNAPSGRTYPMIDAILSRVLRSRTGGQLVRA